jgi:hypothetical protein
MKNHSADGAPESGFQPVSSKAGSPIVKRLWRRSESFVTPATIHALQAAPDVSCLTVPPLAGGGLKRRFRMSLQGHIVELQRRHEALEKEIEKEQLHPNADDAKIIELKRKKLQIKDELAKLEISETRH